MSAFLASIDVLASIDSGEARERRQLSGAVNVLGRSVPVVLLVVVGAVGLALLHVLWLARFRWGQITDWDEAGYMAIALRYAEGLVSGPREFVEAATSSLGSQPPVVPTSAVPLLLVFGRATDVAQVTIPLYSVVLVVATYGVGRSLMAPKWAALAAACVGTAPVVSDYSRLFHFAVPAATFLTAALWALLRSSGLRRTRWVVFAGVLLGLMLTTRTMTVGYLPGVALGVGFPILVESADRRLRARNWVALWLVALGLAALWWVPVWDIVTDYLTTAGYGAEATGYGAQDPILSTDYWTTELQVAANHLFLPLSFGVLACFLAAGAFAATGLSGRRPWWPHVRRWLTSDAFLLVLVVVEGYLALSSTVNQGTAFALPWLPALIVLAVAAASGVRARAVRFGLAALLVGVCGYNLAAKNGVSGWLSEPRLVDVPLIGNVTASDGRDVMYQALDVRGYPVQPPPAALPAVHKRWAILNDRLVRFMTSYSARYGQAPYVIVATGDYFINDTRLAVASEVIFRRRIHLGLIAPPPTVESYRRQFAVAGNNFLLLSDPPRGPGRPVNQLALAAAAQRSGFREAKVLTAPDGRRVRVWWRGASPKAQLGGNGYP